MRGTGFLPFFNKIYGEQYWYLFVKHLVLLRCSALIALHTLNISSVKVKISPVTLTSLLIRWILHQPILPYRRSISIIQKQPPKGVPRKRCSENMQQIYRRPPMPKCDFNKVAKQLYWNSTSAWVFSCKFAAYFQNTSN